MRAWPWVLSACCLASVCAPMPKTPALRASLTAFPPVLISGQSVTLTAVLDDPRAEIRCPTIEWTLPDGTRSSHAPDCDPEEAVLRHVERKTGRLPSGEHEFSVRWSSAGREWRAVVTVEVR